MYYGHFGLNQPPFRITPNTEFFFGGGKRGALLEALIYVVMQGEGMVKVTGEVGSGKTMLCTMLQARLPANVETVYLAHPNVPPDEILQAIALELQLGIAPGASRLQLTHALQHHLLKSHAEGRRVVVFVEESQSMPLATLEEIRLLSNLETRNDKLLQIVLFGQPELDAKLRQPVIRQLLERITHSFRLEPLTAAEIHEYLMFRMRTAGYGGPDLFSAGVVRRIARASQGLTRRINLIADKTLLAAFSEDTHTITGRHVTAAVRDSEFSREPRAWSQVPVAMAGSMMIAAAVIGAALYALLPVGHRVSADDRLHARPAASAIAANVEVAAESKDATARGVSQPEGRRAAADDGLVTSALGRSQPLASPNVPPEPTTLPENQSGNLVEQRLAATRHWLASANPNAFTIQLMEAEHEPQLVRELNDMAKSVELAEIFLYRSGAHRKASLSVLYGNFSDRRAAQDALDKLPPALKANRPFLRTVEAIRAEIRQHQQAS